MKGEGVKVRLEAERRGEGAGREAGGWAAERSLWSLVPDTVLTEGTPRERGTKWKLKQTNFPENFSREDYYAFCDYESREGVIQNPDPSPADPGFFAGLFGKVKYTRQSNRQAQRYTCEVTV